MMQMQLHAEQVIRDREREIRKRIRQPRLQVVRNPSRSVRRAVGRSIMSIGAFVAAEPQTSRSQTERALRLARSR